MNILPPFEGLVAFEAALRHRSMTLAAHELRLTQSAVSHRLKKLETFIGTPLLERTGTGLTTTAAGAILRDEVIKLLDELTSLRARSRAAIRPAKLRIGAGAALAQYWLIRRLPRFASAYPDIAAEIVTADTEAQGRAGDVDVQILWLPKTTARSTSTQRLLFDEHVFPVAAPRLLTQDGTFVSVSALALMPIIHKGPATRHDSAEWQWQTWFDRLGLTANVPKGLRFESISLSLAAAIEGVGVALGRSLLVKDAIADNRLCRVLPEEWDMPSSKAHVIRWPAVLCGDTRIERFIAWLSSEVGHT